MFLHPSEPIQGSREVGRGERFLAGPMEILEAVLDPSLGRFGGVAVALEIPRFGVGVAGGRANGIRVPSAVFGDALVAHPGEACGGARLARGEEWSQRLEAIAGAEHQPARPSLAVEHLRDPRECRGLAREAHHRAERIELETGDLARFELMHEQRHGVAANGRRGGFVEKALDGRLEGADGLGAAARQALDGDERERRASEAARIQLGVAGRFPERRERQRPDQRVPDRGQRRE